jgi:hypothetical protein
MRTIAKKLVRNFFFLWGNQERMVGNMAMGRGVPALFIFFSILLQNSCFLSRPQASPEPVEKANLQVLYSLSPEEGAGLRVELWVQPSKKGGYQAFYRSSPGKKTWLPLWDAAYLAPLSEKKVRRFLKSLDLAHFFALPPVLEVSDEGKGTAIIFKVQLGSRLHQVVSRGKVLPSLAKCLEALKALTGVKLILPRWHPPLQAKGGVELVADLERSYVLHQEWWKGHEGKPGRLLDLFALAVNTGRKERAKKILEELKSLSSVSGLLPALEALLK